jgi:hypothetical protein
VRHLTVRRLHETEATEEIEEIDQLETSGFRIEEIQTDEKILTPMFLQPAAEPRDQEVVLQVVSADDRAARSTEAEMILTPTGPDLLRDGSPQGGMSVRCLHLGGAHDLPMGADLPLHL